jgi:hypothetical protein
MYLALFSISSELYSVEINYNKVIYKNSRGEYFYTSNKGKSWIKLRYTENPFTTQIYQSKYNTSFISKDKGNTWDVLSSSEITSIPKNIIQISTDPTFSEIKLKFESETEGLAFIKIYDVLGLLQKSLINIKINKGSNQIPIEIFDFKSQYYFVIIDLSGHSFSGNFVVVR